VRLEGLRQLKNEMTSQPETSSICVQFSPEEREKCNKEN
jgi:hypothetical protein